VFCIYVMLFQSSDTFHKECSELYFHIYYLLVGLSPGNWSRHYLLKYAFVFRFVAFVKIYNDYKDEQREHDDDRNEE
jgi:hypothetical protein